MQLRSIVLLLTMLAIAVLAALNWAALSAPVPVSLGLTTLEAPLGLLMLGLTALLAVVGVAYVLSLQGSVLLETRRHTKELQAQRELADKAEASRFTELRAFLETQQQQSQTALLARLDHLETRLAARAQESDNSTAAYVGQLEQQLRVRGADMNLV
ncbi:MAG: LapA family protein [Pseudomonadota bacterium]